MAYLSKPKSDFDRVLDVYNNLTPEQKLFVAPRGRFVDSPNLLYRHLAPEDAGFVEMYRMSPSERKAFLTLAVRPEAQGKGIGKQLLQNAIDAARQREDIGAITYRVDKKNAPSAKLGASVGKLYKKTKDSLEYEIATPKHNVRPETEKLIREVLQSYKDRHGVDMSDVQFIEDPIMRYNNGKPVSEDLDLPGGGSWTKHKKIYLTPDMSKAMQQYGITGSPAEFTRRIIAHELGHEMYRNHAKVKLKKQIAREILDKKFTTAYLDAVDAKKKDEEGFAEYVADSVVSD